MILGGKNDFYPGHLNLRGLKSKKNQSMENCLSLIFSSMFLVNFWKYLVKGFSLVNQFPEFSLELFLN